MADINKPGDGGDEKIKSFLEGLTDDEKDKVFEILQQEKQNKKNEKKSEPQLEGFLLGKEFEEVNSYLNKKYVKIKENQEKFGYKGRIVEINLPAVLDRHEGIKLKWFMSYGEFSEQEFEANPKFEDNSYSKEEINNIITGINDYYSAISPKVKFPFGCIYGLLCAGFRYNGFNLNFRLKEKNPFVRNTGHGSMYQDHSGRKHLLLKIPE